MARQRGYFWYSRNGYIVTIEGDGLRHTDQQKMQIKIGSVDRGIDFTEEREATGTISGGRSFAKQLLDWKHPGEEATWEQFRFARDEHGRYDGASIRLAARLKLLLEEFGSTTRQRLESGVEPQIVALCGGLDNALAVLEHVQRSFPELES